MTLLKPGIAPDSATPFGPDEHPLAISARNPKNWLPGDVLLFHARRFGIMTSLIHLVTRSRWNHAALYLGDRLYVEARSEGVMVSTFSEHFMEAFDDERHVDEVMGVRIVGMYDDPDDRDDALAWATGRVGTRYGFFNAFFNGLRHVIPGFVQVKFGNSVICSELVAEALERAGFDFGKDTALVSPGDLATAFGVDR